MHRQYSVPLGESLQSLVLPAEQIAGIIVDNPSGSWYRIDPIGVYIPPNTVSIRHDIDPKAATLDVILLANGPNGVPSTATGAPLSVVLSSNPVGISAGLLYEVDAKLDVLSADLADLESKVDTLITSTDGVAINVDAVRLATDAVRAEVTDVKAATDAVALEVADVKAATDAVKVSTDNVGVQVGEVKIATDLVSAELLDVIAATNAVDAAVQAVEAGIIDPADGLAAIRAATNLVKAEVTQVKTATDAVALEVDDVRVATNAVKVATDLVNLEVQDVKTATDVVAAEVIDVQTATATVNAQVAAGRADWTTGKTFAFVAMTIASGAVLTSAQIVAATAGQRIYPSKLWVTGGVIENPPILGRFDIRGVITVGIGQAAGGAPVGPIVAISPASPFVEIDFPLGIGLNVGQPMFAVVRSEGGIGRTDITVSVLYRKAA